MDQNLSKYDQMLAVLPTALMLREAQKQQQIADRVMFDFLALGTVPLAGQNIIEDYNQPPLNMLNMYLGWRYDGGPKPEWVTKITG